MANLAGNNNVGRKPLDIPRLMKEAANFEYDAQIPLRYWLRTADVIQKQAQSYSRSGDDQDEYLFLMRHALLVLEKLSQHDERKLPENRLGLQAANKQVKTNIGRMEALKPGINKRYERYQGIMTQREMERRKREQDHGVDALARNVKRSSLEGRRGSQGDVFGEKHALDANENEDIVRKLAHRDIRRRRGGLNEARKASKQTPQEEVDDLADRIIQARKAGDETFINRNGERSPGGSTFKPVMSYPTVPKKSDYEAWEPTDTSHSGGIDRRTGPPSRPPKGFAFEQMAPPRPGKFFDNEPSQPTRPSKVLEDGFSLLSADIPSRADTPNNDLDPRAYTIKPSAFTESGNPLRTLHISPNLRKEFLRIAQPNTSHNLETCGILCGMLTSNAFFVSHLIIPEQESTSDTCDTLNESSLFDYCDSHDLMTLGWIHTHPTQTCFMSSRDQHTQAGYQVQMAEAVAIVCAPRDNPDWNVYRLTDPPGLKTVLRCEKSGVFHPHEGLVYTDCSRGVGGHVRELPGLDFEVVDLRP